MDAIVKPFRRILVAIDFSDCSRNALHVAVDLSRRYLGALTLIHVYEPSTYALPGGLLFLPQPQMDRLFADLQSYLDREMRTAQALGALQVDAQITTGFAAGALCDFAKAGDFDLIVMGTHGRTGLSHALLGSVAERVTRLAHCPVLTVRAPA